METIINVYNGIFLVNSMISFSNREVLMSAMSILMTYSCEIFMLSITNIDLEAERLFMCFEMYWCVLYEPLDLKQ